jgi:hypothetical protein
VWTTLNTVTFTEADGRTRVTLLIEAPNKVIRDAIIDSGMEAGLQDALDLLEGRDLGLIEDVVNLHRSLRDAHLTQVIDREVAQRMSRGAVGKRQHCEQRGDSNSCNEEFSHDPPPQTSPCVLAAHRVGSRLALGDG